MYARTLICPCMPIYMSQKPVNVTTIPRGLTARIAGFHPAGPGSTPGVGTKFLFVWGTFVLFQHIFYMLYYLLFTHMVYTHILDQNLYMFVCATELQDTE